MIVWRVDLAPQGGVEVFAQLVPNPQGPCNLVYLAPHLVKFYIKDGQLNSVGLRFVEDELLRREAERIEGEKRAAIEAALNAEFERRKAGVDWSKTPEDAMPIVFPTAVGGTK